MVAARPLDDNFIRFLHSRDVPKLLFATDDAFRFFAIAARQGCLKRKLNAKLTSGSSLCRKLKIRPLAKQKSIIRTRHILKDECRKNCQHHRFIYTRSSYQGVLSCPNSQISGRTTTTTVLEVRRP